MTVPLVSLTMIAASSVPSLAQTPPAVGQATPVPELRRCEDALGLDTPQGPLRLTEDCVTDHPIRLPDGVDLDGGGHTVFAVDPPNGTLRGGIVERTEGDGDVRHLTIDGSALTAPCDPDLSQSGLFGIVYLRASGTVEQVAMRNLRRSFDERATPPNEPGESEVEACGGGVAVLNTPQPVTIDGLTVANVGYVGVLVERGEAEVAAADIDRADDTGILALYGGRVEVGQGTRIGGGSVGIQIEDEGSFGHIVGSAISGSTTGGIFVSEGAQATIEETTIEQSGGNGIGVEGASSQATLSNNTLRQHSGIAIKVLKGNAEIVDNDITGAPDLGVYLNGASALVAGNEVSDPVAAGVVATGGGVVDVVENRVSGGSFGIGVGGGATTATVARNAVTDSEDYGIVAEDGAQVAVTDNEVSGAGDIGIYVFGPGTEVDTTDNDIDGPGEDGIGYENGASGEISGNRISGAARAAIWVSGGAQAEISDNRVSDAKYGIVAGEAGTSATVVENVIDGVVADGVQVLAGATVEVRDNIVSGSGGSGIVVRGAEASAKISSNDVASARVAAVGVDGGASAFVSENRVAGADWGIVVHGPGSRADVTANSVDAAGTIGILISAGAEATVARNGVIDAPLGITVSDEATHAEVSYNAVRAADTVGIRVNGAQAEVTNNTIEGPTGADWTGIGPLGIEFRDGATGTIHDNVITGVANAQLETIACAIAIRADAGAVDLAGNRFPPPGSESDVCDDRNVNGATPSVEPAATPLP